MTVVGFSCFVITLYNIDKLVNLFDCIFNSYQMLDYRIGSRKETRDLPIKAKRDTNVYRLPNLTKKTSSKRLVKEAVMIGSDDKTDDKESQEQDFPYVFTPNKMPTQRQLFYQLCDLHDPEIQRLISRNDGQVCLSGNVVVDTVQPLLTNTCS